MSDQPVRTVLDTDVGTLSMQEYFVKQRAEPCGNDQSSTWERRTPGRLPDSLPPWTPRRPS